MKALFSPKSLAVIGASRDKKKIGAIVLKNHLDSGFKGKLYPINPKAKKIMGLTCYPSVLSIGKSVDCAVVCVPAKVVPFVVEDCGKAGVKYVVILSSGFSESGAEGKKLEDKIISLANKYKIRIVGPNGIGVICPRSGLNMSFVSALPYEGPIAFVSQSGAMGSSILDLSFLEKFGFSKFVSIGNKSDLTEADFLRYLADDPKTKVILLYIEGLTDGPEFMKAASYATKKKPVLVLKSGRTEAGARAASSHTGSLTGSDDVYEAAFAQCGVIRVRNSNELFRLGLALAELTVPKKKTVAIVTNSGGPGIMASDAVDQDFRLANLSISTVKKLQKFLPPQANFHNPVDVVGDADVERFSRALDTVLRDKDVGSCVAMMCPQKMVDMKEIARSIVKASRKHKKPIVGCLMGGASMAAGRQILTDNHIPNFLSPEDAVNVLESVSHYHHVYSKKKLVKKTKVRGKVGNARRIIDEVLLHGRESLTEDEGMALVSCYGVPTISHALATSKRQAVKLARRLSYPVVMKISSPDIMHKTDAGCVLVNVSSDHDVKDSFDVLLHNAKKYKRHAKVYGVTIESQTTGKEVIVGITRDPQFGPVITFGLGGVYVEVLKDVSRRVLPISVDQALEMMSEIKTFALLKGVRGEKPVHLKAIAEIIVKLGQLALDFPEISSIEINPLMVTSKKAVAVDVLCTLQK